MCVCVCIYVVCTARNGRMPLLAPCFFIYLAPFFSPSHYLFIRKAAVRPTSLPPPLPSSLPFLPLDLAALAGRLEGGKQSI